MKLTLGHVSGGNELYTRALLIQVYPDQALLLLVTGALGLRILNAALRPALPVLNSFKVTPCTFILMLFVVLNSGNELFKENR